MDEVSSMVMRLIDYLKGKGITGLFTHLIPGSGTSQEIEVGVSSLIDTWILLRNSPPGEQGGRHLSILKSRGMPHSSDRRSFELSDDGPVVQTRARRFPHDDRAVRVHVHERRPSARAWGLHGADDTMPGVRTRCEVSTSLQ